MAAFAVVVVAATNGAPVGAALLVVAVLAVLAVWAGARRRVQFRIDIEAGKVCEVEGNVPRGFVQDVDRLCRFWGIERGWIKGVRRGRGLAVTVGGGIDRQHTQVFRNAWNYPLP